MTPDTFFKTYYPAAEQVAAVYNIPALSILAQSANETGFGSSVAGNNMFGIKADAAWTGKKIAVPTHEVVNGNRIAVTSYFRAYDSPRDSFADFAKFIKANPRYKTALQYTTDPIMFSKHIAAAGYATDPNYFTKISELITEFKKKVQLT